ncbi:MAG: helix-turn-helix transcriptional regulator [Actinobacteria bacterium]|nr:helix-turn-helix transcriptional regulator [Actinomycetota bacterium]
MEIGGGGREKVRRGGELIKEARLRAGLTQQELADRMGSSQSVIVRWESGQRSPTVETLVRAARASGLDVAMSIVARDIDHERQIRANLRRTPEERLDGMVLDRKGVARLLDAISLK